MGLSPYRFQPGWLSPQSKMIRIICPTRGTRFGKNHAPLRPAGEADVLLKYGCNSGLKAHGFVSFGFVFKDRPRDAFLPFSDIVS